MPDIKFDWGWEADKPSKIHCGHCGFPQTIVPTADDLKDGFNWYCLKCGSRFIHGDPKPIASGRPEVNEPTIEQFNSPDVDPTILFGYPQTKRLFERKKAADWIILMVGENIFDSQKVSTIATKLKAAYRFRFGKNPQRERSFNTYSGLELNVCIGRMFFADKLLANELRTLHLEKIRKEVNVGSIIFGNKGIAAEVKEIVNDYLVVDFNGELQRVDRSSVVSTIQANSDRAF